MLEAFFAPFGPLSAKLELFTCVMMVFIGFG